MQWMKDESVLKRKADKMDPSELEGKLIIGEFINRSAPEYSENLCKLLEDKCTSEKPSSIRSAYRVD